MRKSIIQRNARIRAERLKNKVAKPAKAEKPKLYYGFIKDFDGMYRWWRSDNPGDMFDMITTAQFEANKTRLEAKGFEVRDLELEPD